MTTQPAIHLGDYGDGTIGLKTSLHGYDVTVRGDDDDVTKRSFNSEWVGLLKVRSVGAVSSTPVPYQWHQYNTWGSTITQIWRSGFYWQLPVVPLPFDYIPIWEERCFNPTTKTFFDDDANPAADSAGYPPYYNTWSGGRSWITTQSTSNDTKNNTSYTNGDYTTNRFDVSYLSGAGAGLPLTPPAYAAKCLVLDPNFRSSAAPNITVYNQNIWTNDPAGPKNTGYPAFPATPVSGRSAYVMFGNKLGDWS